MDIDRSLYKINNSSLKSGFRVLYEKLSQTNPDLFQNKYLYVNIWSINCQPCIDELYYLNNFKNRINKRIGFVLASLHSDKAVSCFLTNKNIQMQNFLFANEMIDFISGVYNEIEIKNLSFPTHIVLDKKGNCLAYLIGAIHNESPDDPLINFINNLT